MLKPTLIAAALILTHTLIQWLERRYLKKIERYLGRMDGFEYEEYAPARQAVRRSPAHGFQ